MIRRIMPTPWFSLLLLVVWLLLNKSISPGQLLLGSVLAILVPLISARLSNPQPAVRKPLKALRYCLRVLGDIVVANLQVARVILRPAARLRPAFVEVPLDISRELPITVLASTVSLTPGTVSADLSPDRKRLLLHVLHLEDEAALIDEIKTRYEAPLKEIFGC